MSKDIPLSKLEDGFRKGIVHIQKMIDSSIILHKSEHHSMSIAISILTHEELAKLRDMVVHISDHKPIIWKEWKEISGGGSHKTKLKKLYDDVLNDVLQMGPTHHEKVQELNQKIGGNDVTDFPIRADMERQISLLENLNDIKKECIYLDWKDGDWITFEINTTTHERAALAEVLYVQNLLTFLTVQLEYKYPTVFLDERSFKFKAYKNEPIRKQLDGIENYTKTKTFAEKNQTATSVIKKYSKQTE